MQRVIIILSLLIIVLSLPVKIQAQDVRAGFVTIVQPVRDRSLWGNKEAHLQQLNSLNKYNLPATWLLQYSTLFDNDLVSFLKKLPSNHELGIFLEVDEKLANMAYAAYLYGDGDWARADKVLFSGYAIDERKRMIVKTFEKFKEVFGYYPSSVGSWYIDTISLGFMVKKYQISATMDVADQYQTDTYGVWGKPWGRPYFPAKINSLYPSNIVELRVNPVNIQWAARDPIKGYGYTVDDSTYSVQVNDYLRHNLDINYFSKLSDTYLLAPNGLNQLTVGLEVGQEGFQYASYYEEQLGVLSQKSALFSLKFTTMKGFAKIYSAVFRFQEGTSVISSQDGESSESIWYNSPNYRVNIFKKDNTLIFRDLRSYYDPLIFFDVINKDFNHKLQRFIPPLISDGVSNLERKFVFKNVSEIKMDRLGDILKLDLSEFDGSHKLIEMEKDKILVDNKTILFFDHQRNFILSVKNFISDYIVSTAINKEYGLKNKLVYTILDGKVYFGLTKGPDKIYALSNKAPFWGKFSFPFQVLSRFKKVLPFSVNDFILNLVINILNSSKYDYSIN